MYRKERQAHVDATEIGRLESIAGKTVFEDQKERGEGNIKNQMRMWLSRNRKKWENHKIMGQCITPFYLQDRRSDQCTPNIKQLLLLSEEEVGILCA